MNQISNNPGQQPQGQHSVQPVPQQHIRFQQHPGYPPVQQQQYPNNVAYQQQHYPQNMMYANPAVVNNATLTLPQNSSIYTSQTNGMNMVDIVPAPAAPYGGGYEQPTMIPHIAYPHYGMYAQQQYQPTAIQQQQPPAPKPVQPPREKKILSFVDPNTNATINLPEKKAADVSTASSPFEPNKHDTKPHTPVNEVTTTKDAVPAETEDINSAFGRLVANRVVPVKNTANNQPQHEEEHHHVPAAAPAPTTAFTSTAPPFVPTSVSYEPAVSSSFNASAAPFNPASLKAQVAELVKDATPSSKEQSPAADTPQKVEHSSTPEPKAAPSIVLEEPQPETSGVDEEKNDAAEIPQNLDRASLMQSYENKIDEFFSVPENVADVANKIYSRKLVQLLRDIIRTFHTVPCPISEQELKRIGIDRATMPQSANVSHKSKYQGGRGDNFNPSWNNQQNVNVRKPQYTGRGSRNEGRGGKNDGNKQNQNRAPPITNRPSIQRVKMSTLTRDPNAWKPDIMNAGNSVDLASVEARIAKVRKDVRGLLNKITPTTYADLSVEMINKCVWRDPDTLPTVVELIFIKAVEEPTFVGLYSDLCHSLHKAEQNMEGAGSKRHFHGAIIRKCQTSFESTAISQFQESISKVEEQIKEEQAKEEKDEKKIADLNEQLEDLKVKEKRRMLGTIKFISHLFRIGLLNYKIIENCIVILIRNAEQTSSELMTEYAVDLMKYVGPYVGQRKEDTTKLDSYVGYLDKFKATVSNRVKFMIVDLTELRDKKWVKKGDGPKTKDEVKMDVLKEEEQNKRERDVYDADQNRKKSNVIDKHRQNYNSRPSIDKKDRQAAAVVASSNSGQTLKKDTSLLKFDQQRLGSTKKWGANTGNNANAPTNASSPSNKGPGRVISRLSQDARNNSNDARKSTSQKDNRAAVAPAQKADPRSASATPPPNEPSSSRSQNNTPTFTPEDQFKKDAFKSGFKERLQSYLDGVEIDDIAKSLIEFNGELNNPVLFFEQMFAYCCEHLKLSEAKERHAVSTLVAKCYQDPVFKNAFAPAFKKYCKYLVTDDVEGDVPHLKTTFPEFVARLMTDAKSVPNNEFVEGFKEFHESENYMFARTLAEFGRILHSRKEADISGPLVWLFEEFANADEHYKSDDIKQIFARQQIDYDENHKNLKELLSVS